MARPTPLLAKKKVKKQGTHVFRRWQHDRFKCVKVRPSSNNQVPPRC